MNKKYEFTGIKKTWVHGKTLHQIRAIKDFGDVHSGELGGFIEKEANLSHEGKAWIGRNAVAYGDTKVYGDAKLIGWAKASGETRVYGSAVIAGQTHVNGNAWICGEAFIKNNTDYITVRGLWESGQTLTAFLNKNNEIQVNCTDFSGSLNKFMLMQLEKSGGVGYFNDVQLLKNLIETHFRKA